MSLFAGASSEEEQGLAPVSELEELEDAQTVSLVEEPVLAVFFREASFRWTSEAQNAVLELDSLQIPDEKLTLVVGEVGAGKSSLLAGEVVQNLSRNDHFSRSAGRAVRDC